MLYKNSFGFWKTHFYPSVCTPNIYRKKMILNQLLELQSCYILRLKLFWQKLDYSKCGVLCYHGNSSSVRSDWENQQSIISDGKIFKSVFSPHDEINICFKETKSKIKIVPPVTSSCFISFFLDDLLSFSSASSKFQDDEIHQIKGKYKNIQFFSISCRIKFVSGYYDINKKLEDIFFGLLQKVNVRFDLFFFRLKNSPLDVQK